MEKIIMSLRETQQVEILEKLIRKEITQINAAKVLKLSERQIRRKILSFKNNGLIGLTHKNRGKISNRIWDSEQEKLAINLLKNDWNGFGPTFAAEKLLELHKIKISAETLRNRMIENGLWAVNSRRISHRIRRVRKSAFGIMIQLDGSPHDWFEGRAPKCTLLVFIDDATSKIVWLEFSKGESVYGVMKATKNYFQHYGIPASFYVDYGSVFSVNKANPNRDKITQFERAMKELEVEMIHANSPQAKGRVERSNKTHQDRLIKEMRLHNISSIENANIFLQDYYMEKHNLKFAKEPADSTNVHRSSKDINLDNILCIKSKRQLNNDFTIVYQNRIFQLERQQHAIIKPKDDIIINLHLNGSIHLSIRKIDLSFKEIHETLSVIEEIKKPRQFNFPSENSRKFLDGFCYKSETKQSYQNNRVG